ncbi:hypothetical protein PVK06_027322 [Gossypium arboreum]|uniref:Uncharacterized protein n=1 Tax=Gossypium arboreum TaxID=29729 RepID=A0ABR0P194_GOSAR|nr:hypothetical protein PVK06_027322 [Gossypium arboreum]
MMPEKGLILKSNDLMVVPVPIRKKINALKWERFCDARSLPDDELVREFYTSLTTQDATEFYAYLTQFHHLNGMNALIICNLDRKVH